jgi:serine/threonine protein kinase
MRVLAQHIVVTSNGSVFHAVVVTPRGKARLMHHPLRASRISGVSPSQLPRSATVRIDATPAATENLQARGLSPDMPFAASTSTHPAEDPHLMDPPHGKVHIVALTTALHLWLQGLGDAAPTLRGALDRADDAVQQLANRRMPCERSIAAIMELFTAPSSPNAREGSCDAESGNESTDRQQQSQTISSVHTSSSTEPSGISFRAALSSLVSVIATLTEKCAALHSDQPVASDAMSGSSSATFRLDVAAVRLHHLQAMNAANNRGGATSRLRHPASIPHRGSLQKSELKAAITLNESFRVSKFGAAASFRLPAFEPSSVATNVDPSAYFPATRRDSQASLTSNIAIAVPMNTLSAVVNDECDDGTIELNQYVLFERLGQGAQGEVFLASDSTKNELRAIKAVRRPRGARGPLSPSASTAVGAVAAARQRQRDQLEREVLAMKKLRHRNVVRLYEVIDDPELDRMYLVMQYVEHGPLVTMLPNRSASEVIDPKLMVSYARQICAGLEYLHKKGVIHRDIKPDNILLGRDDCVYLADFGTAEVFGEADAQRGVTGTRGTMAFLAPELLLASDAVVGSPRADALNPLGRDCSPIPSAGRIVNGEAVDVWALGVTFYVMLYGTLPWEFKNAMELFRHIEETPITFGELVCAMPNASHSLGFSMTYGFSRSENPQPLSGRHALMPTTATAADAAFVSPFDLESEDEAEAGPHSPSVASPTLQQQTLLTTGWRAILKGMLDHSPGQRSSVRDVRRQLAALAAQLMMPKDNPQPRIEQNPITTVRRQ